MKNYFTEDLEGSNNTQLENSDATSLSAPSSTCSGCSRGCHGWAETHITPRAQPVRIGGACSYSAKGTRGSTFTGRGGTSPPRKALRFHRKGSATSQLG